MTTHAKYAKGRKPQPNVHGKMAKLIAERQADIAALIRAAALLDGAVKNGKVHRGGHELEAALELDSERHEARVAGSGKKAKAKSKAYHTSSTVAARRKATDKFLAKVGRSADPYRPKSRSEQGRVSVLIQHGYIKAQGSGYVRTEKEFAP